jgi:diaminohydroxyphosphoribosylaminopyrimidine deaminase/5-amino-6-(5-phosphoribosylamino)uracil reductase
MNNLDEKYMRLALRLAAKARGRTSPNPMVGALVVKGGKVISRGYHLRAGGPHGEARALVKAGAAARGATLYVTLEPCSHRDKRTPPCTPLVARSGVKRVVVAMIDPNPRVSGKGIRALRSAGISVTAGLLETEARKLNEVYIKHITTGMPFVTLKIAQTLDGKIATAAGESKWITGELAREEGRRLRAGNDAILVGINTVLGDDPSLTTRIPDGRDPVRVIVDSTLRTPLNAKVMQRNLPGKTIIATLAGAPSAKIKRLQDAGAEVIFVKPGRGGVDLRDLMRKLGKRDLLSVLIEGGSEINASAFKADIVDKVVLFVAPLLMTGRDALCSVGGVSPAKLSEAVKLHDVSAKFVGQDLMIVGYSGGKAAKEA